MADEGVSWLLEIDGKTGGLDAMLKQLDHGIDAMPQAQAEAKDLTAELHRMSGGSEKAAGAHGKHAREAHGLTGAFQKLVHAGMEPFIQHAERIAEFELIRRGVDAIVEAPEKLIEKVVELGEEALKAAAAAERMDLSFKLTLGAEGAEGVLGWIDKISSKTEFTDDQLKGWTKELLNAGVKASEVDKFLAAGLDVAAKSPDKLAGMGNAINALTRAALTGRVEGRALRGLQISIDEIKALPEFKGLTDKAIREKLEKGAIKKEDLLKLIAGPDKQLGDLGLRAGQTLEARLKNLQTLPEQYFQRLAESPAFDHLKEALGQVFDALDPNSERGARIFEQLDSAFTKIVDVVAGIDFDSIASTIANDVVPGMVAFVDMGKSALEVFKAIGSVLDGITGAISKVEGFVGITHKATRAEERAADPLSAALQDELRERLRRRRAGIEGPEMGPLAPALDRLAQRRRDLAKTTGPGAAVQDDGYSGFVGDIMSGLGESGPIGAAMAVGSRIGKSLLSGARGPDGIDAHSPSRKFAELGEMAAEGFESGFSADDSFAVPSSRMAAAGGRGGVNVSIPSVVVTMHGSGNAREDGQAAGEGLAEGFREHLTRILEEARREAGA